MKILAKYLAQCAIRDARAGARELREGTFRRGTKGRAVANVERDAKTVDELFGVEVRYCHETALRGLVLTVSCVT
jgi:hypothetical protein